MKDVAAAVSALYRHPKMFDTKAFEKDVEKHLKSFFKRNSENGFFVFAKKFDDLVLLDATISALSATDLRKILKQIDGAWLKPRTTLAELRHRAIALATGRETPASDISLRAKALLPSVKAAKTLDVLRSLYRETGDSELSRVTFGLFSSTQLQSLARRFDKFNSELQTMSDDRLIAHIEGLASCLREPASKTIASAAAKAKWSGKEPD